MAVAESWYLRGVTEEHGEKSYATGAWVDMTTIVVQVDRAALAATLARRHPLALSALPVVPRSKHPVCVELWRVRDGRPEAFGLDQHEWSETAGSALGSLFGAPTGAIFGSTLGAFAGASAAGIAGSVLGPIGALWGVGAGFLAGAAMGGRTGGAALGNLGERVFREGARGVSELASRTLGTYHEVAVLVPGAVRRDGSGPAHQLVWGMKTDSPIAKWTAEVAGYGFGKELAAAACEPFEHFRCSTLDGRLLLDARFSDEQGLTPDDAAFARLRAWGATPFLGPNINGELVEADVDRLFDYENSLVSRARGELFIAKGFGDVLEPGRHAIRTSGAVTALHVKNVFVRVTRPKRFEA